MLVSTPPDSPVSQPDAELAALRRRVAELEERNHDLERLRDQLGRGIAELRVLQELAVAMQSAGEISEIQERVLSLLTDELGYERAMLAMVEPNGAVLTGWLCSTSGPGAFLQRIPHTARISIDAPDWLLVQALRGGEPLLVNDDRPPTGDRQANAMLGLRRYVILPMVLRGLSLGLLIVDNPLSGRVIDEDDRELLADVARQAAVVIGGVRLMVGRAQSLAVEEERGRIAMEIHDAISQQLYGISYSLGACLRLLPEHPEAARDELAYLVPQAQQAMVALRRAIFDLWPGDLDAERFENELHGYLTEVAPRHELQFFIQIQSAFDDLPTMVRKQLYRIAQEALNNIIKHAQARRAKLTVLRAGPEVHMRIADDGRGFDMAATDNSDWLRGHFGLANMRERAEALGGHLRIDSAPGEGTTITVVLPIGE